MERLTKRIGKTVGIGEPLRYYNYGDIKGILDRLAEIEDILGDDYDLDRLSELVEAERDGRCTIISTPKRLMVYENLECDVNPERLLELANADQDGRCVVLPKEGTLKKGDKVWHVDRETGEIEGGTVFSSYYKNGLLDTFSVDFDDGDFDEFIGIAWGTCIFGSQKYAEAALIKWKGENK